MPKYKYNAQCLKSERVSSRKNNNEYLSLQRISVTILPIARWSIISSPCILLHSNILIVRQKCANLRLYHQKIKLCDNLLIQLLIICSLV